MLKDHGSLPSHITKEALMSLIRKVNTRIVRRSDLTALDFPGFQHLILQLAYYMYTRPPKDLSHLPIVETLKQMISDWRDATRNRGQSTILYEDPDATGAGDMELCLELNKKLHEDPTYPIPEGYSKGVEKIPIYNYRIPESAQGVLSEGQIVATEVFDEFLFELLGVHFIEPLVTIEERPRVRPRVQGMFKPKGDKAEALNYMKKIDRNAKKLEPIKA